jgi:signal transduction histidine kinase
MAQTTTAEVASLLSFILAERQRQVQLFAEDQVLRLRQLRRDPDSEARRYELERILKRTFPDVFAYTITDARGRPLLVDFDGYVGEVCVQDIQGYASSGRYAARIHPNHHAYHYDVMARWRDSDGADLMLMVSFTPTELGQILKAIEPAGHELMLVSNTEPPLIEVTARGARDKTPRSDYRLGPGELGRLLARQPVAHSLWSVADFVRPGFVAEYRQRTRIALLLSLLALGVIVGAALVLLRREERRRQAAERAREDLLSMVTHEMRTPVTALSGTLALMRHGILGELPGPLRESMALLERNAERLRRLIDDLLESRLIESGQLVLRPAAVPLAPSVRETLGQLRDYAQESGVTLELAEPDGAPLWVRADPLRLQQITANLVSNAAKFSPSGGTVRVAISRGEAGMARVTVRDEGPGIPAAFQARVFEKFARGPAQPNRPIASSGLGLSIVKALVEAQGGRVGFVSAEGRGATFHFELPLVPPPDGAA